MCSICPYAYYQCPYLCRMYTQAMVSDGTTQGPIRKNCMYESKEYSPGSTVNMNGKIKVCNGSDGEWY
ncbi:DUF1496 domain-containing protein [Acetivibrio cellulolyticus]|uniref:DUF1496 domain-containing protein n=1 Tax=Acetivibrio cellulolyticus TaxID=35830 RepID=UPI0001E2D432|nr:DUF1496 domain-containing protein [Acetivibrio cellulolyticus]